MGIDQSKHLLIKIYINKSTWDWNTKLWSCKRI